MTSDRTPLLEFPCEFIIKVMGKNTPAFEGTVLKIFNQYVPDLSEGAIASRLSKEKNFLAMTVTFSAINQHQIDEIYTALSASDDVIMAL
jgi:putative lipoic acid-binding regulatory protein